jgi:hypothetical protein
MARPSKLDEQTAQTIVHALELGVTIKTACQAAGIGGTTFKTWMARGRSDDAADALCRAFRSDVKEARAHGELADLKVIHEAMPTTWTAAAWYLERSRPERWGRRDRLKARVGTDAGMAQVRELRRIMNAARD